MSKNIVLCCDGTDNQFSGYHTNVIRAYKVAVHSASQVTYYDCGVGTMPAPGVTGKVAKWWSMMKGLAFGSGFKQNVMDAYTFLMNTYEPGDQVYLFGFSRGAYTVRALAGMLYAMGLLRPHTENLIPYAYEYWKKYYQQGGEVLCDEFKKTLSRPCPVHFIGVWDTVSSLGYFIHFKTYPFTAHNPEVMHFRHAVSIDERRCFFHQNLMFKWKTNPAQDIKNVWFAGVHSDVGGGYPKEQAGLAKLTFEWMMREAAAQGMQIDQTELQQELFDEGAKPDPLGEKHESLKGFWWLCELIPQRSYRPVADPVTGQTTSHNVWTIPLGRRRNVERNAAIPEVWLHQAVLTRLMAKPDYRPGNIPHTGPELRTLFQNKIEA